MSKPTAQDIIRLASLHYGLPMAEILEIVKTPTHPSTLRDEFAGKALPVAWHAYDQGYTGDPECVELSIAHHAYQIADAMLKAREA